MISLAGLLGTRSARSFAKQQRKHDRLFAQGRAPPAPFPGALITAVVKVVRVLGPPTGFDTPRARAQAHSGRGKGKERERARGLSLDEAAQRLEDAFGRGSGSGREVRDGAGKFEERQRRRLRRAESGLRAYELGTEVGRRVAGRLERHRSRRDVVDVDAAVGEISAPDEPGRQVLAAVTPAALLGSPPIGDILTSPFAQPRQDDDDLDDDLPLVPPSAPSLRPTTNPNLPPFPTVSTPLALEPAALDDYFGLSRRTSSRRTSLAPTSPRQRSAFLPSSASPRTPFVLRAIPARTRTVRRRLLDLVIFLCVGSPPRPSSAGLDTSFASVGGILGVVVHAVGFFFFVAYHLSTLIVASLVALRQTATFLYWFWMNLSGRTEVARAVVEYWRACRAEWDRVVDEDGEEQIGLWSVGQGLFELAVLQTSASLSSSLSSPPLITSRCSELTLLVFARSDVLEMAARRPGPTRPPQRRQLRQRRPCLASSRAAAAQAQRRTRAPFNRQAAAVVSLGGRRRRGGRRRSRRHEPARRRARRLAHLARRAPIVGATRARRPHPLLASCRRCHDDRAATRRRAATSRARRPSPPPLLPSLTSRPRPPRSSRRPRLAH